MSRCRISLLVVVVLAGLVWAAGCGDGATEPPSPPVDPPRPTIVTVSPATAELTAVGAAVQFAAEVLDQYGQAMTGATVTWTSGAPAVATVSSTGLVTAAANGTATITAAAGSASGTAAVTVVQKVSAVTVLPAADTLLVGDTLRLSAAAADANGHPVADAEFSWASSDTLVVMVDDAGLVTGVGAGQANVTATAADITGRAALGVVALMPTTVAVTPDTVSLTALGQTVQLTAEVRDQRGQAMEDVQVTWTSADTTVAAVDSAGLVTAAGVGEAAITATSGEASGEAVVTVIQTVDSVAVSPAAATIAPGDTIRLAAEAFDANGHGIGGAQFTWSSNDASVAAVDGSGLVSGVAEGTATITAASGSASGTSGITVQDRDRSALVALYEATDGPNWVNNRNWLTDRPLGDWYGVRTDASGNLESLILINNNLVGPIPPELGKLGSLESLTLLINDLIGPIPPELGDLGSLESLNLGYNHLSGSIPPELGNLANLTRLLLTGNDLSGGIPSELGGLRNLEGLSLAVNDLSGSIPRELGNLANLTVLSLGPNDLSGPIPPELGNLANLTVLTLGSNDLTGPLPPELGNLANLTFLNLARNDLSGAIPPEIGNLTNLEGLSLSGNDLSGPVPKSFLQLGQLEHLGLWQLGVLGPPGNQLLCAPGVPAFSAWLGGLERHDVEPENYCNVVDMAALESLFEATGGTRWIKSANWAGERSLEEWHGVTTDAIGRVTSLDLTRNGLNGPLPGSLGNLTRMTELRIGGNALTGSLPLSFTQLPLRDFRYPDTGLCFPGSDSFKAWLNTIVSHDGTGVECQPLSDREILEILYHATDGPNWRHNDNWLSNAPLRNWRGVGADGQGRVVRLSLRDNNLTGLIPPELGDLVSLNELRLGQNSLTGPIPPELGNLASLTALSLEHNDLTAPIPPELGNLANLTSLSLDDNSLSGPIPPELGNLANLTRLNLGWIGGNDLSGAIPPELGNLANLISLFLDNNSLSGPIPPELGDLSNLGLLSLQRNNLSGPIPRDLGYLANISHLLLSWNSLSGALPPELGDLSTLEALELNDNRLSGPVPREFSGMASLRRLGLAYNPGMSGVLPIELVALDSLEALEAAGTGLCAPRDTEFQAWLAGVLKRRVASCNGAEPPMAYLVQAVQSRVYPVPLVAGEDALLRVFPTSRQATGAGIPAVRARFYRDGREAHVANVAGKATPIPTEVYELSLARSANVEIPGRILQPGIEMVIDIDPEGTLDPALGVAKRIPETGRLALDVHTMPPFDLTLIPFIWSETGDTSIVDLTRAMAADPEGHEMFADMPLLPIGELAVTAHEPVLSSSNNPYDLVGQTEAIRAMEAGTGHYMGMMSRPVSGPGGLAFQPGRSSFSLPHANTIAHELGHNLSLSHTPCGGAPNPDPSYPHQDGSIGAWGYDSRSGKVVHRSTPDVMGYCRGRAISDYHFTNALRFRLFDEGAASAASPARSLLLWGGANAEGQPFLEPVFVVDAPAVLPDSIGRHRITGRAENGRELFSIDFTMPEVADGDGRVSFAFVLPVGPGWEGQLASIALDGPGGSTMLDGDSDLPMAILRNPRSGQIRGILRDPLLAMQAAADGGAGLGADLEVLFSRGIPGPGGWWR